MQPLWHAVLPPDTEAAAIITARHTILAQHFRRWHTLFGPPPPEQSLEDWFCSLERRVSNQSSPDSMLRQQGRERWRSEALLPLANDLQVGDAIEATILHRLYRSGSFDFRDPQTTRIIRPAEASTLAQVRDALTLPNKQHIIEALLDRNLCPDRDRATRVVYEWRGRDTQAAAQARGIVLAYSVTGACGLLHGSNYAYTDELRLLAHQFRLLHIGHSPAVFTRLLHDMIALCKAWAVVCPHCWGLQLLTDPPGSSYRIAAIRAHSRNQELLRYRLHQEGLSLGDAEVVIDTLLQHGLPRLIAYRLSPDTAQDILSHEREQMLLGYVDEYYAALSADARQEMRWLVQAINTALHATQTSFPLRYLLTAPPGSRRRLRYSRQISFGVAAQQRRRAARIRKAPARAQARFAVRDIHAVVTHVATSTGLEPHQVINRLRDLITYGAIGLITPALRDRCVDPSLREWLRLIKYGRLDGRLPWPSILHQLEQYRIMLGLPHPIPGPVTRALVRMTARPVYWHGGQGEATAQVRQRGTLILHEQPRLHDHWIMTPIEVPYTFRAPDGRPQGYSGWLILVMDAHAKVPLAIWPSSTIDPAAFGLALYDAIWHPGHDNWPIKGLPEHLTIMRRNVSGDFIDLQRAATYILCDVNLVTTQVQQYTQSLVTAIKNAIPGLLHSHTPEQVTGAYVRTQLTHWMHATFFSTHRPAPVWASIRQHGVVMPGHLTPAAGWLLPVVQEQFSAEPTMRVDGLLYHTPPPLQSVPLRIRRFPYYYPNRDDHLCVQVGDVEQATIQFMPRA